VTVVVDGCADQLVRQPQLERHHVRQCEHGDVVQLGHGRILA
jgi:hypothetical protein